MDTPYRSAPRAEEVEAPRDAGIAGDVIGQFADPLAFYRELVQNAIDAGSAEIDVEVTYDDGAGAARAVVRDRGEGMDRTVIEEQLLVLFRSTKEKDPTKIGKFGIGFASVLAPGPRVVTVTSSRGGRKLVVHLYPDLAYELFDGGAATRTGTSVELELAMPAGEVAAFAGKSREALERWCKHASVPIHFRARGPGGAALDEARIDRPLGLDGALLEVRGTSSDGACTAVVGVVAGGARATGGFYNHGLTLRETDEPLLGPLAFKIQDARLGHTLSREDVRRDASFERAVDFARSLAADALPRAAGPAVRAAAEARDHGRYRTLIGGLLGAKVRLDAGGWALPLLEPLGERRTIAVADLPRTAWGARTSSAITRALARDGRPVVDLGPDAEWLPAVLAGVFRGRLVDVERELTEVTPIAVTDADRAMLALVAELLRDPAPVDLAELSGALAGELVISADRGDAPDAARSWVIGREHATRDPFAGRKRLPLALAVAHPLVIAARRRADDDPVAAASLLARAILLRWARLDVARSAALLAATVARLGVEPGA